MPPIGATDSWRLSMRTTARPRYGRNTPSGLPAFPDDGGRERRRRSPAPGRARPPVPPNPAANIGVNAQVDLSRLNSRRAIWEPGWWLRLGSSIRFRAVTKGTSTSAATDSSSERSGEGTTRPTAGASGAAHQREHPRPGRLDLVVTSGNYRFRTAGPGAAIHRGELRPQADVPRRDRGQPTPGDDAVTVAITVEHNEARGGHLWPSSTQAPTRRACAFTAVRASRHPATTPASAMLVEIQAPPSPQARLRGLLTDATGGRFDHQHRRSHVGAAGQQQRSHGFGSGLQRYRRRWRCETGATQLYLGGDARMVSPSWGKPCLP